jgi:predicted porin
MHRFLFALCALGATELATAQSTVTIFGVVDMSLSSFSNSEHDRFGQRTTTRRLVALTQGGLNKSRLGFRGTEDLGGGLSASFWLQSGIVPDDGSRGIGDFRDRSTVSLSGTFGEFRLGRDYTPSFNSEAMVDPFNETGAGLSLLSAANVFDPLGKAGGLGGNVNYVRGSNAISYFLPPDLWGLYGQVMHTLGEDDNPPPAATPWSVRPRTDRYSGIRLGYAAGPWNLSGAYGRSKVGDSSRVDRSERVRFFNIAGSYDFATLKLMAEYSRTRASGQRDAASGPAPLPDAGFRGYLVGLTMPLGAGMLRASYARVRYDELLVPGTLAGTARPRIDKWAIGYVHNLSLRTALYATVSRLTNREGPRLNLGGPSYGSASSSAFPRQPGASTGYELGLRHWF